MLFFIYTLFNAVYPAASPVQYLQKAGTKPRTRVLALTAQHALKPGQLLQTKRPTVHYSSHISNYFSYY